MPKIKWHARTGGCVVQPRKSPAGIGGLASPKYDLSTLEKPAETLGPTTGNNKTEKNHLTSA